MRIFFIIFLLAAFVTSCDSDADILQQLGASTICPEINGNVGLMWDLHNGLPRTDLPGGIPPTVNNVGGSYSNPVHPLLGFIYPAGYTPQTLPGAGTVGAVLTRNDNAVLWKYLQSSVPGFLAPRDLRDFEITSTKAFYGLQGSNIEIVCINEPPPVQLAPGLFQGRSNILFRVGNFTSMIIASTTLTEGLNTSFTSIRKVSGPTAEFNNLALETFLAIDFQLLLRDPDKIQDSDLDGVPDAQDREPFNPNVQ